MRSRKYKKRGFKGRRRSSTPRRSRRSGPRKRIGIRL